MGLFDLFSEVVSLPFDIASTTVKTAVRVTGAVVTLDPNAATEAVGEALEEAVDKAEKVVDSVQKR